MNTLSRQCLLHGSSQLLTGQGRISGPVFSLDRSGEGAPDLDPHPQEKSGPEHQSESERPHGGRGMIKTSSNPSDNVGDSVC